MNKFQVNRFLATLLIITFSTSIGCSTWRPTPAIDMTRDDAAGLKGKRVRFHTDDGVVTMLVKRVEFPYVYGVQRLWPSARVESIEIRVDLREVNRIETCDAQAGQSTC